MMDFEVNAAVGESRLARLLVENLPAWLEEEIRNQSLSVCAWDAQIDPGSAPQPNAFDVVVVAGVTPWSVLRGLGSLALRHLLVYSADDANIATRIDPDFQLSSCRVVDSHLLLVYSRTPHCPQSGAIFERVTEAVAHTTGDLSRELGRATALLELRDAELRKLSAQEGKLQSDLEYWQAKAAALARQLEQPRDSEKQLRAELEQLQKQVDQLTTADKNSASELETLHARASAATAEAASLRRLVSEVQTSLSWRITAPLRALTKPLFAALAPKTPPPGNTPLATPAATLAEASAAEPGPIESIILPELRRARSIAVIQCAIPFSSTLNQRPISYAKHFADQGYTVLFVELWQCPEQAIHQAGEQPYPRVFTIPFYAFQPGILHTFRQNLAAIAAASQAKSFYLCTIPEAAVVEVARPLRAAGYHIHYDIMDDWEEFHGGGEAHWYSAAAEREIVLLADSVTAVSEKLVRKFDALRTDVELVRNGYHPAALNCEQFAAARTPLAYPKTIGYFGHLSDAWFDWDTVFHAARQMTDVQFELIGYGLSERSRVRLNDFPNVRFEGLVAQRDLHRYARKWWAGIIPFRPSTLSAAVDPLKVYEYLHFGLNTVVSGIPGIAGYPMCQSADDPESFLAALRRLPDRPDEQSLAQASEFLKTCVWEARLARLSRMVSEPAGLPFLYAR